MASAPQTTHDSRHNTTWGINGFVIVLTILSVVLRFYTRIFTRAGLKADDWLILFALITSLTTVVLVIWGNSVDPNGLRASDNTDQNYVYSSLDHLYIRLSYASTILYFTVSSATKLGILVMYHRIFAISQVFRYQLFVVSALVIGWWFGCTVAALRKCKDLEAGLNSTLNDPRYCINFNVYWMAAGVCEIILDAWILTLPLSVVLRMHYSLRQKFVVSGIFLLGAFSIGSGIAKTVLAYQPGRRALSYANTEIWAALHTSIAILCASLPIFRPLAVRIAQSYPVVKITSLLTRRRKSGSGSSHIDKTPSGNGDGGGSGRGSGNKNGNARFNQYSEISFIDMNMVQDYLKQPSPTYSRLSAVDSAIDRIHTKDPYEEMQELAPQLPQIERTDSLELSSDIRPFMTLPPHKESRETDH
ncbi:hypothetical protein F4813DRAFT_367377 [Daldinia decipiens]|uniref:uncharacterized protein n=1 Tax=Daldinia decipiens TaxID=326647 RepID=UPI0020C1C21F|nr:uncharacterized protein F4813DRAFT_367377 [Daldinia decipiens]KAI1655564.1 hypothetical protein F4813DRAFT_367377 [Daldinia decipiens]